MVLLRPVIIIFTGLLLAPFRLLRRLRPTNNVVKLCASSAEDDSIA